MIQFRMIKKQILILENNQKNFETLNAIFAKEDFDCSVALDKETLDGLNIEDFDLVLVNSHVQYIDVVALITLVHADFSIKVPILYLDNAKEHDKKHLQECFNHGVCEYFKKPFDKLEILARVLYHFHQFQKMKEYKLRVDKLARLATMDQLSKSSSKMHMNAILKHEVNNYKRYKVDTSIIYMSLVNVDKVVGVFGFEKGEKLISMFAKELKKTLRESDALARWVGSEFIILLTNTDAKNSRTIVQKINETLSKIEVVRGTKPLMAFGITQFIEGDDVEELMSRVQYALKEAKKQSYGRIEVV